MSGRTDARFRLRQAWTIAALQLRRVFFTRRSAWVYLLAFFPAFVFFVHALEVQFTRAEYADDITPAAVLATIREGDSLQDVIDRAGEPLQLRSTNERTRNDGTRVAPQHYLMYFDGGDEVRMNFDDGLLLRKWSRSVVDFAEDRMIYAGIFQYFYLRLAIFFGCLGIFINLFRGEMLDETLHFWFLVPTPRWVLLLGKYIAGLVAAVTIFVMGAAASFLIMLWPQDAAPLASFWPAPGMSHLLWYCAAAALACVGYGSVFVAAGMLLKNPIVPAVLILFWEGINSFLPAALQRFSVLYYVGALTPVPPPIDPGAPRIVQLLLSPAAPPSAFNAILGLLALTAVVLWIASRSVRSLEINYSTD